MELQLDSYSGLLLCRRPEIKATGGQDYFRNRPHEPPAGPWCEWGPFEARNDGLALLTAQRAAPTRFSSARATVYSV